VTWDETAALLAYLTRLNPAMRVVEGMVDAWHGQLAEFDAHEVEIVARRIGGEQTWVGVADIKQACKRARSDRLSKAGDLYALVDVDPSDALAYHAAYLKVRAEVASGRRTVAELEVGR
jgi:hypothetical protein